VTAHSSVSPPPRQSDEKVVEKYEHPNEPVEFRNMRVMGVETASGEKFSASARARAARQGTDDWLAGLEFTLKNRSDKQITHILFQLQFPETVTNGPKMSYNMNLGVPPYASATALRLNHYEPLALNPGESIKFSLAPGDLKGIRDFLASANFQLSALSTVVIKMVTVNFTDGTKWEYGYLYRHSPNAPAGWERIN
jgi:hypothetical protein